MEKDFQADLQSQLTTFQIQRIFASLGRGLLVLMEDLKKQHEINFDKLRNNLPREIQAVVDMSDYFDANAQAYLRKKILDAVNGAKRDLESNLKIE